MRKSITTLAILGLLVAPAYVSGAAYTWGGATSDAWHTATNWPGVPGFPGQNSNADTALINNDPNSRQPVFSSSSGDGSNQRTIAGLTLDSDANGVAVSLLITGDTLTISGSGLVLADADGANDAVLRLSGGTLGFDSASLSLYGGDPSQANFGEAIFDLVSGSFSDDVDSAAMRGFSSITSAESVNIAGALTVDAPSYATDAEIDMASTKSFTSDSLAISVPDNATSYEAILSLAGAGSYAVTNAVTINGTALANVEPKLVVSSSAASASFGSISLNGGDTASREAVVDADQNVTVSGNATFTGYAQVDVASGKTLASDALQAGHVSKETRIVFSGVGSFVTN